MSIRLDTALKFALDAGYLTNVEVYAIVLAVTFCHDNPSDEVDHKYWETLANLLEDSD